MEVVMDGEKLRHLKEQFPKLLELTSPTVGDGWYDLLFIAFSQMQRIADNTPGLPQPVFNQIKEKFGGLRLYYFYPFVDELDDEGITDENPRHDTAYGSITAIVDFAEEMSNYVCEDCGDKGHQRQINGWLSTKCDKHTPDDANG
tara:strand:+ start:716 stop:1150 length:435 start_codon:yes stop_codon:yes gene_type:complete